MTLVAPSPVELKLPECEVRYNLDTKQWEVWQSQLASQFSRRYCPLLSGRYHSWRASGEGR